MHLVLTNWHLQNAGDLSFLRQPNDHQLDLSGVCFLCENLQTGEKNFERVVIAGDPEFQDLPSMLLDTVEEIKV